KSKHKLPFDVTSPDFIRINGVPYLAARETEGLS
ncbi:phage protein, partial [Pseudomonas sp. MH2]